MNSCIFSLNNSFATKLASGLYAFGSLAALAGTVTYAYDGYDKAGEPEELESDFASTLAALNISLRHLWKMRTRYRLDDNERESGYTEEGVLNKYSEN